MGDQAGRVMRVAFILIIVGRFSSNLPRRVVCADGHFAFHVRSPHVLALTLDLCCCLGGPDQDFVRYGDVLYRAQHACANSGIHQHAQIRRTRL